MVYLTDPHQPSDLVEDDFVILEENRASETHMRQTLREKLQAAEANNKSLETALSEKDDLLRLVEVKHARELLYKEIETKKIVDNLQEQLDEAKGQLYGGQPQSFSNIPEPHHSDAPEYCQHAKHPTEEGRSEDYHSDILDMAVSMASKEDYQGALVYLDTNISPTHSTRIHANATLIKSAILRICNDPKRGLELAEHVVYIANLNNLPTTLAHAQLYRGHCLDDLGLYADALRCYVRAASIKFFARDVPKLTAEVEKKRAALPSGSRGKYPSPDFQEIPLSTSAKGFGSFD
jgi:tetratricopeptide (TPR) repeat protein